MTVRRIAAVALGVLGATAAASLATGMYASSTVDVFDASRLAVGSADAADVCSNALTLHVGLARFSAVDQTFLVRDVSVSGVGAGCTGLTATVVGVDGAGTPIVEGAAAASSGSFTVALSNAVEPAAVARWHVVLQDVAGDAVDGVTPPAFTGSAVSSVAGEVEPLPSPSVSASPSPSPSPSVSMSPVPSPSDSPTATPSYDPTAVPVSASPTPTVTASTSP